MEVQIYKLEFDGKIFTAFHLGDDETKVVRTDLITSFYLNGGEIQVNYEENNESKCFRVKGTIELIRKMSSIIREFKEEAI